MAQPQKPGASPFPSSPAGVNFTPRKEFTETPPRQSSSFALLTFSSNNAIRLSNFPRPLVTALSSLLDAVVGLRSFRENAEHKLAEIVLIAKPWSSPKSLSTEIVVVQVFNVLLAHGFSVVSQLDYGREYNDRLSLVFSRAVSILSESQQQQQFLQPRLVSFALSFLSPTILRVICPPLHATPAILQSVRGAWPRGVNNEKKLGEGCYEFKLKGYSWLSEDTFHEDALANTLSILTALDRHGCNLLTSVALTTSRPRNKDLWLFSAPSPGASSLADPDSDTTTQSPVHLGSPLKPSTYDPIVDHIVEGSGDSEGMETMENGDKAHTRGATVDVAQSNKTTRDGGHARSLSDTAAITSQKKTIAAKEFVHALPGVHIPPPSLDLRPGPPGPGTIHNTTQALPPPRAQTETIHVQDLPQCFTGHDFPPEPQYTLGLPPAHPLIALPEATERHPSDEDFPARDSSVDIDVHPSNTSTPTLHASDFPTPPLLPPAVFRGPSNDPRDSRFSAATGHSFDVPIKWIPPARSLPSAFPNAGARMEEDRSSITTGPLLPGGWLSTPSMEGDDSLEGEGTYEDTRTDAVAGVNMNEMPERQSVCPPHSPEIVHPTLPKDNVDATGQETLREGEAGILGVIPSPTQEDNPQVPPAARENGHAGGDTPKEMEKQKEGWVLVNVAQKQSPEHTEHTPAPEDSAPAHAPTTQVTIPASQIIAAVDSIEATLPSSAPARAPTSDATPSSLRRFFSRSNHKADDAQKLRSVEREADAERGKSGRFRRKGGVLPTLRSGKRSSIE